ncbi:aminopeptidase N [Trichonephila clavipes]|nr:aminopeptidase N [Trichonephila clavipes]
MRLLPLRSQRILPGSHVPCLAASFPVGDIALSYLNWSLTSDSGIRRQDGSYVFRSVGAKLYGRDLTFNYVRDKWDAIFKRYGKSFFAISSMLKSVTSSLNTQFELLQLKEFYAKQKNNLGTAKRAFQQSLENAEANVRWMDTNYAHIVQWLDNVK